MVSLRSWHMLLFHSFKSAAVNICEWVNNFISHLTWSRSTWILLTHHQQGFVSTAWDFVSTTHSFWCYWITHRYPNYMLVLYNCHWNLDKGEKIITETMESNYLPMPWIQCWFIYSIVSNRKPYSHLFTIIQKWLLSLMTKVYKS